MLGSAYERQGRAPIGASCFLPCSERDTHGDPRSNGLSLNSPTEIP